MSTLSALLARLRQALQDPDAVAWSDADLTLHLRNALHELSQVDPLLREQVLELAPGGYELDLSALAGLLEVVDVWYPWDPDVPRYPPPRPSGWSLLLPNTLLLDCDSPPTGGATAQARVIYTCGHTVEGLDGAEVSTLDAAGEELLLVGAAAEAGAQRGLAQIGVVTPSTWTPQQLAAWAAARRELFTQGLERVRRRRVLRGDARVAPRGIGRLFTGGEP